MTLSCLSSLIAQHFNYCLCTLRHFCFFCHPLQQHGMLPVCNINTLYPNATATQASGSLWLFEVRKILLVCKILALGSGELNLANCPTASPALFCCVCLDRPRMARSCRILTCGCVVRDLGGCCYHSCCWQCNGLCCGAAEWA